MAGKDFLGNKQALPRLPIGIGASGNETFAYDLESYSVIHTEENSKTASI